MFKVTFPMSAYMGYVDPYVTSENTLANPTDEYY